MKHACSMSQCRQQPSGTGLCGFYAAYHMNFMINRAYDPDKAAKVWLIGFTNFAIRSDLA